MMLLWCLLFLLPLFLDLSDGCALKKSSPRVAMLSSNIPVQLIDPKFLIIPDEALAVAKSELRAEATYPAFFDLSREYPKCNLRRSFYQGPCGTCWALASATVISDAICSKTGIPIDYSAGDLLGCCGPRCGDYNGGYPYYALEYITQNGTVTGGYYGPNDGCYPYRINDNYTDTCPSSPLCKRGSCSPNFLPKVVKSGQGEAGLQRLLYDYRAPVVVGIYTNSDFYNYKSGTFIEKPVPGKNPPDHAVKVIGWGTDYTDGSKYWIVINSWGPGWGMNGTVHVRRGFNDLNLEYGMGGVTAAFQ